MNQKNSKKFRKELRKVMAEAVPTIDNFVDFINKLSFKARCSIALKILRRQFKPLEGSNA